MNNIKDKLALMAPSLVFGEGEPLTVTVPAGQFRDVAKSLRDDPQMRFDLLLCMTGMDWGETLGVVYHLRSTELGHEIVLRTETADRENPELQSVYDLWESANLNEREVYDFFGIRFIGHPDMRPAVPAQRLGRLSVPQGLQRFAGRQSGQTGFRRNARHGSGLRAERRQG